MPVREFERALADPEKRELQTRLDRLQSMIRVGPLKAAAASVAVCGVLAILTLVFSDASRLSIVGFWLALAILFTVWIGVPGRTDIRRQHALLTAALQHDRGRGFHVQSNRVVEFDEIEDEGACFAFDIGDGRVLFVLGQEFYPDDEFPNADFSLVSVLGPNNVIADEIFVKDGTKLVPERRIAREVKDRLTIPDHLEIVEADLATIESTLPRR